MICQFCSGEIPADSAFCPLCGKRLECPAPNMIPINMTRCPNCGNLNSEHANFCTNCQAPLSDAALKTFKEQKNLELQQTQMKMQAMSLKAQQEQLQLQQQQYNSMAKCPRCGSTSLSGNKKGFGIGKAVVGAALIGPFGLVAGNIGAKKVQVTCLNCGKKFKL